MKKLIFSLMVLCAWTSKGFCSPIILVYEGEEQVLNGQSFLGTSVGDGFVVSADRYQSVKGGGLLAGDLDGALRSTSLVRLDIQLNAAFLKWGDLVSGSLAQDAHKKRASALKTFLPQSGTTMGTTLPALMPPPTGGAFQLQINGQTLGTEPLVLKKRLKKSKFKLDIVNVSSSPVWNVEVELESDPKLAFWKEGRKTGLNEIPQKKFQYSQQILFRPLATGKSVSIPVEVFFIEGEDYVWAFKISSKNLKMEQNVLIKFKP